MLNKVVTLILIFWLAFLPTIALAEEPIVPPRGKITGLRYKQRAPYSGVLLNSVSAAKLLTNRDFSDKQWQLKLDYELAKQAARLNLTIESQKISYGALDEKYKTLNTIKDSEIERLSAIASGQSDYSKWWATGGVVVGIVLTIAVVYAVQPGTK
tara:strand:- start:5089 stop:5553 length:465 start_codon:yes stop_codon:yes gene_type:complete